jgi:hypothetical protein
MGGKKKRTHLSDSVAFSNLIVALRSKTSPSCSFHETFTDPYSYSEIQSLSELTLVMLPIKGTDSPPLRIACPTSAAPAFTSSIVTGS